MNLQDLCERIVRDAIPATDSGATCFVPRYQIDQLREAIAAAPQPPAEAQAPTLWCMHIHGPGDVHPAPSKEAAEQAAKAFNERYAPIAERTGVMAKAVVAEWPHSPESHAESVGTFLFDWIIPAGHPTEAEAQGDPGEFGVGIQPNPKARYWQDRAEFWKARAVALGWREKRDAENGEAQAQGGGEIRAWGRAEDGRVISSRQKAKALRDGGASASSVAPYTTPLYTAPPSAPVAQGGGEWGVLQIGATGSAYDPPDTRRAFTYAQQPGNVLASRLGGATKVAASASAGDSIDRGLSLLKALQDAGFGVFQLAPAPAEAQAQGGGEVEWRWLDEKGRAMTKWKAGPPPPITAVSDSQGAMSVETRTAPPSAPVGVELDAAALGRFAQDAWMDRHLEYPAWGRLTDAERAAWVAVGERIKRTLAHQSAPVAPVWVGRTVRDWLVPLERGESRYIITKGDIEELLTALAAQQGGAE